MRNHEILLGVIGLAFALAPRPSLAQDTPSSAKDPAEEQRKWVPLFQRHAGEYVVRIVPANDPPTEARWLSKPVLRWWQPVRGGDDGALYLWLHEGRPVAAVTFFTFKWPSGERAIVHERHSFSALPVEAEWRGRTVWRATVPGVTYQAVPGAPKPAETPAARLRQMQAIARDFSAHTVDDQQKDWPLRLLPTPLYRFEAATADSLDGAIFALVQGTDPEAFLLLDARGAPEARRWEFAAARFTDRKLVVQYKGRLVFAGEKSLGGSGEVYHSQTVLQRRSERPEDFY